jgi:hypothetical protein
LWWWWWWWWRFGFLSMAFPKVVPGVTLVVSWLII